MNMCFNKKTIVSFILAGLVLPGLSGCAGSSNEQEELVVDNVVNAASQYALMAKAADENGGKLPGYTKAKGEVVYINPADWRSGFFPGSLWYLYKLSNDEKWKSLAEKYTEKLEEIQYLTNHHDVGFMIGCSYLNGLRFAGIKEYAPVIVQTAKSLSTRFRPNAGVIQSWDVTGGWQSKRGWECPVIIDNMMNLELLFEATALSGDSTYYNIAVSHADRTLENHFRNDNSCYHVVDYDLESGTVRSRQTAQGYADESAWARGQAWAIYGYTMCYRYTHNPEYLKQACNVYEFIFTHKNLPQDLIPYWDFDALNIPKEPRDVSAAAVIASALYELYTYAPEQKYKETADRIVQTLSTPAYRAEVGTNGNFILMHSVGSIPHNAEIDVPLNYADYYFLEALARKSEK